MNSLFDKAAKLAAAVAAPVFQYRGWTWGMMQHEHIPPVDEICDTIKELLHDAARSGYSSTGRLTVERDNCEDGTPAMYNIMLDIGTVLCDDDGEPESVEVD